MFARFITAYKNWRAVRRTENALYRLSPHQLEDIGLTTWTIPAYLEGMKAQKRSASYTHGDIEAYAATQAAKGRITL